MRTRALLALMAGLALAVAGPAPAATVGLTPRGNVDVIVFTAAPGEHNNVVLTIQNAGAAALITDSQAFLDGTGGCAALDPHRVRCTAGKGIAESHFTLGDGNDRLLVTPIRATGSMAASVVVDAGPGDDKVLASGGYDRIDGGPGDDELAGGSGEDVLTYAGRTHAVAVDLLTGTGGERGERDRLRGFETVVGGDRGDRLAGDDASNTLSGGPGADLIAARGGDDDVMAGPGDDTVTCGAGADTVRGVPTAATRLHASCELLTFPSVGAGEGVGTASVAVVPRGPSVAALRYRLDWFDAWSDVHGTVTWREAAGLHRTLGRAAIAATSEEGAALPVRLTTTGRRLVRRPGGIRAIARVDATLLPRVEWTATLRVPSR